MATYLLLILFYTIPSILDPVRAQAFSGILLMIFVVTFFLPAFNIVVFRIFGSISSLTMPNRRERIVPFTFVALLYAVVTYLFYIKFRISLNDNFLKLLLVINFLVFGATIATYFYKISVHSLGICGILGVLFPLNTVSSGNDMIFYITIVAVVIAGMVMSSRLQLHAHTPREVMVGAVLGFLIGFTSMIMLF
jgi:membrane-associated phospholipid phosphatase